VATPIGRVLRFASSPQGRKMLAQAVRVARSEEGRKLIAQARKVADTPEGKRLLEQARRLAKLPAEAAHDPANARRLQTIKSRIGKWI